MNQHVFCGSSGSNLCHELPQHGPGRHGDAHPKGAPLLTPLLGGSESSSPRRGRTTNSNHSVRRCPEPRAPRARSTPRNAPTRGLEPWTRRLTAAPAEHWIVAPVVAGSIPVIHPAGFAIRGRAGQAPRNHARIMVIAPAFTPGEALP